MSTGRIIMRRPTTTRLAITGLVITRLAESAVALALTTAAARADDIVLRGMGPFHVGWTATTTPSPTRFRNGSRSTD
jgi:hypothetical protein